MNFQQAHNRQHIVPATGRLLIAEPFLADPNFTRSVIYLCELNETGTVGFVLNHPTDLKIGDLLPELYTPRPLPVFKGGPVQVDTLHMLHRAPELLGGQEIADGIFWGGSYETLQQAISNDLLQPEQVKLLLGYSGWSAGQLEQETQNGSWMVGEPTPGVLFGSGTNETWKLAVDGLGKDYSYMKNLPLDPQFN